LKFAGNFQNLLAIFKTLAKEIRQKRNKAKAIRVSKTIHVQGHFGIVQWWDGGLSSSAHCSPFGANTYILVKSMKVNSQNYHILPVRSKQLCSHHSA
jgi:hypothetical protein